MLAEQVIACNRRVFPAVTVYDVAAVCAAPPLVMLRVARASVVMPAIASTYRVTWVRPASFRSCVGFAVVPWVPFATGVVWLAAVAAPAGSGRDAALTATVPRVAESTMTCCGTVNDTAPLIGCVACQKVPVTATVPVIVVEARDTGCVACQNVPVTGVVGMVAMLTGCVAWKNVPDTGCVACQNVPVTGVVGIVAMLTGCVACQKVPETGCVACQKAPVTATEPVTVVLASDTG